MWNRDDREWTYGGPGVGPLRSESARLPSVVLALAAPGHPVHCAMHPEWSAGTFGTLRVQGPTLRDAALAHGGDGSPPVAPRLIPPALRQVSMSITQFGMHLATERCLLALEPAT